MFLTVKNKGRHLDPPLKNSGVQQRGLQQTVPKVLELYPQASQVCRSSFFTYIDLMHLETLSVMHPGVSGLSTSYTLVWVAQLG